jgi:uncharacterized repeat protein (TIGR01451 family)
MTRKKLLLIVVVCVLAVSIPVTVALMHNGQAPPDGGGGTADVPTDDSTASTLTILSVTDGNIFVMKAGTSDWIEAQVGMALKVGDIVRSGNSSGAQITFFDGSTIDLDADTQIEVAALNISSTGSTTIGLRQVIGTTVSRVTQLVDTESSYEIETPTCVAAVRGSAMEVKVIGGGITWVTNLEGHIWVTANGVELEVPEGQKCIITPGGSPQLVQSDEGGGGGTGGGGGSSSPNLDIELTKVPGTIQAHEGDTITYTYSVTNSGDVPLSSVSVTDNMIEDVIYQSGDTNGDGRLGTDETWTFSASHNVTADDPSPLVNTAAAAGSYAGAGTVIAWARASVDILRPAIALEKTADPVQAHEGDIINYTYTIANTGNTALSDISLTDDKIDGFTYQGSSINEDEILDTGETWVFTATHTIAAEDGDVLSNIAAASSTDALDQTVESEEATATVDILRPAIALNKTADREQADVGDDITYTYTITNTGNTPLSNISITDDKVGSINYVSGYHSGDANEDEILDMDETWIFMAYHTITTGDASPLVNTATASGSDALDRTVESEEATASVDILTHGNSIRIELTWNTADTDLDAHFIRPSGVYGTIPDDCFYENENPDWGLIGVTEDNPSLDRDDLDGYGPEIVTLAQPSEQGVYQYKVHYYTDRWHGPSLATVKVLVDDVEVAEYSKVMSNNDVWDCFSIEWQSGWGIPFQE